VKKKTEEVTQKPTISVGSVGPNNEIVREINNKGVVIGFHGKGSTVHLSFRDVEQLFGV
jgi:hypothetical protein